MIKFTEINRQTPTKRGVMQRIKDFDEVYNVFDKNQAKEQSSRCIQCGNPYCHSKCPLHNMIPTWLKLTANDNLKLAFDIANATSPFPEILGRICPHDVLCEGDCSLNDTHEAISIGAVETHISEKGFDAGYKPKFSTKKTNKKVAIIGSGPAGISVATFLLYAGIHVDMYERDNQAGGLLTYGIPGFKLNKNKIKRRIDFLINAGMNLNTNCEIGKDKSFQSLEKEYDAIFVGIGATKGRMPNIDGEEKNHVYLAMQFLKSIQQEEFGEKPICDINIKEKNVVVIGGGDTAMDCVRTAIRKKAKSVKCLYRRNETDMPGSKKEFLNAKEEGAEFIFNVSPAIIHQNSITVQKTKVKNNKLEILDNSKYDEKADIVIMALGFTQAVPEFLFSAGIELDTYSGIKTTNTQTNKPHIFAGGDSVRGANLAVRAAADGKDSAKAIIKYLND